MSCVDETNAPVINAARVNGKKLPDGTAAAMCSDNDIPLIVFDLHRPDNIYDAVVGKKIGTMVNNQN